MFAGVAALDELESGIGPLSNPEIADALGVGPGIAAALTIGVMAVFASIVEPFILWRLRGARPRVVVPRALIVCALSCACAGLVPNLWLGLLALTLFGPASGVVCAFAEVALVAESKTAAQATTTWGIASAIGDLLGPALLAVTVWLGGTYQDAFLICACASLSWALAVIRKGPVDGSIDDDDDAPRASIRAVIANRPLLIACIGATACAFLDEIFLGIGASFLDERFGPVATKALLGACVAGGLVGSLAARLVAQRDPARILAASAAASGFALAAMLVVDGGVGATIALFALGFATAAHHPLATALSFTAAGRDKTLAPAVDAWFGPVDAAIPFVVAFVAETVSVDAALAFLALQPLILLWVALVFVRRRRSPS